METDRPTLNFTNPSDGVEVQIAFGYHNGEPTAALFYKEALVLIPKELLQVALDQGWTMDCPDCDEELSN